MAGGQLEDQVRLLEKRVAMLEKQLAGNEIPIVATSKRQSAREFLATKRLKAETQKVLVFGYFLERHEAMASFNVSDLDGVFRSARETPPKNLNDAVNKNVARGLIMEAKEKKDSKKAWQLTSTGERHVEEQLI